MKPLIYLKINPKYENFEANALKNKIQELLIDQNVVYSTSLISDDYDVAHFINLDDVSYFSNNSKKNIKKVISLFYSENDIYGNILKITNKKDEKEFLPYEISNYDIKILNLLDLILVPSNEAKNYLINIGITKKIEILKMPLKISNYELKNSILHKAIYSYFRLKEDSFLIVTTVKHNDIEAFKNLFVLLEKFPKATFVCISQFANKGLLNIKIKSLLKRKPKNLIFTTPLTIDLYNSLMYNAKIFLNLSSIPSSVLECYEAMASKTQIFALESSCFKDILIDKKNCYLYNNIDLLRVGIDQYLLKLIDSTTDDAFNEVKEMTISESANKLINYYKVLTEEKIC